MWTAFWGRFLQASSSSSDLTKGPEGPHGLARKERAIQTCGRSTSLSGKEEVDLSEELDPLGDVRTQRGNIQEIAMAFLVVRNGCELDYKEIWAQKNWCFWTVVLRVPWMAKRSNQFTLKEISTEYSLEGLMLNLKLQYFGHLMHKSWPIGKNPDAWKDWRQEEKGMTEDEMIGWHHRLNRHGFGWILRVGDG